MDDVEVEDDSAAMAAMMGFSGFGNQNALSKKRKFNTATDAFVEGVELEKIDRGGKKGQGSGGNQIPLGKMRVMGVNTVEKKNNEEIDLGDDEDVDGDGNGEDEGPRYLDTSAPPPIFDGIEGGEHALGQDGVSQDPAIVEERRKAQEQIDAILAAAPEPVSTNISQPASGLPHGLPEKPVYSNMGFKGSAGGNRGGRSGRSDAGSMASSRPSGRGAFNEKWYEGYYDQTFNENPWAKLEQKMRLGAKGNWV